MSVRSSIIRSGLTFVFLLIIVSSYNVGVIGKNLNIQFDQLNPIYHNSLFGVALDYNSDVSSDQAIHLHSDLLTGEEFSIVTDPDPSMDNNISLIGYDSHAINSAFLTVEKIKRSEFIPLFGTVEWQASLPYHKYLSVYRLPSGESIIQTQDLLGLTLRLDGQKFSSEEYLVGYANLPIDFIEFLFESINTRQVTQNSIEGHATSMAIPTSTSKMDIEIQEINNELTITTTFSNVTYLFQTNAINIEQISSFHLSENFILVEFESISYTTRIMKYSTSTNTGVETQVEMMVGDIQNLVINEQLPSGLTWDESMETHIEKEYSDLIHIDEIVSWYQGNDIDQRLTLFNQASLSFLFSHNLGVIEGSESKKSSTVRIDGQNISKEELIQTDISVKENITISQKEDLLLINHIKGHDYALQQDPSTQEWSLIPATIKSIALNQHPSLSGNILFLEEASILNPIMVDAIQRYIANASTSSLSTDQLLKIATLHLTSSEFIQEFQIDFWTGVPTKMKSISTSILESNNLEIGLSRISFYSWLPGLISLSILVVYQMKRRRVQK